MHPDETCPRLRLERLDRDTLCDQAALSSDARYAQRVHATEPDDVRPAFHRDTTRILHSRAFRRLRHKTQVFISPVNDHLCTRMEHCLHVASVATTIAQVLRLNVDLVNAIAIGHDLGHAPFGHTGERCLASLAHEHGIDFSHELHSLRIIDEIESPYVDHPGLNLTFAVRDGIACHYGEGFEQTLAPDRTKSPDALLNMQRGRATPATLEGCVVRWADKIAYMGRDLEDALALGIIRIDEVPADATRVLGASNATIISRLVRELIRHGIDDDRLSVSDEAHQALETLYRFSFERIYLSEVARRSDAQIERAMRVLFDALLDELDHGAGDSARLREREPYLDVFADFLETCVRRDRATPHARIVVDFIAGMTDAFFTKTCGELLLPRDTG